MEQTSNPGLVLEQSFEEELPVQRSALDDIKAFENVLRNPLSYEERGILVLRYRVRLFLRPLGVL